MTLPIIILEKHISGFSGIGGVLYQPFGVSQDYKLAQQEGPHLYYISHLTSGTHHYQVYVSNCFCPEVIHHMQKCPWSRKMVFPGSGIE